MRIKKLNKGYTQVSNILLNDDRVSFKAKGLFAFMDSKPDEWTFTISSIASQSKEGKDSIMTAIQELKKYGYINYYKHADGSGIYELIDEPKSGKPKSGKPKSGKPKSGFSGRISNKDLSNKDLSKTPLPPTVTSTAGKPQHSRRLDRDWNVLIQVLRDRARLKSKIKDTDEAYQSFLQVEDRSTLVNDYLDHLQAKGDYAKNLTNFLLDYKPKSIEEQIDGGEVVIWA